MSITSTEMMDKVVAEPEAIFPTLAIASRHSAGVRPRSPRNGPATFAISSSRPTWMNRQRSGDFSVMRSSGSAPPFRLVNAVSSSCPRCWVGAWPTSSIITEGDHHRRRGVSTFDFGPATRSLSRSQVLEIAAMGHRLGAHNDAHRDLSKLHDPEALSYEIDSAIEQVADLTGSPCEDFAIAFGQPSHLSVEATRHLLRRCRRVYSCVRGLNVPGRTPRSPSSPSWSGLIPPTLSLYEALHRRRGRSPHGWPPYPD